MKINNNNVF